MAHLISFSFEIFYETFTEDASLFLLCHGAKKSKTQIKGGPAVRQHEPDHEKVSASH